MTLFHERFPPIQQELIELAEFTELVADQGGVVLVDGRLVLIAPAAGGGDPGGYPV